MKTLRWDFFGPRSQGTAEHFERHLRERLVRDGHLGCVVGVDAAGPGHRSVWCRCPASTAELLRALLRPQRVE